MQIRISLDPAKAAAVMVALWSWDGYVSRFAAARAGFVSSDTDEIPDRLSSWFENLAVDIHRRIDAAVSTGTTPIEIFLTPEEARGFVVAIESWDGFDTLGGRNAFDLEKISLSVAAETLAAVS